MTDEEKQLIHHRHYVAQWLLEARRRINRSPLDIASLFHAGSWDEMAAKQAQESKDWRTREQYKSVHDFLMKSLYNKQEAITDAKVQSSLSL